MGNPGLIGLAFAVIAQLALSSGIARAACEQVVEKRIRGVGVEPFEVEGFVVSEDRGAEMPLQGYEAWVKLKFLYCKGYLIINLDTLCRLKDEYTAGDCEIPGVPRY